MSVARLSPLVQLATTLPLVGLIWLVPVAMVHSEAALPPPWARSFYAALGGPKRNEWLASRGHTDFYDDPGLVSAASDALAAHFAAHLAGGGARPPRPGRPRRAPSTRHDQSTELRGR